MKEVKTQADIPETGYLILQDVCDFKTASLARIKGDKGIRIKGVGHWAEVPSTYSIPRVDKRDFKRAIYFKRGELKKAKIVFLSILMED